MNEKELVETLKKQQRTISELNDYLNAIGFVLEDKKLIDMKEVDKRFKDTIERTYNISGEIVLTKYNYEETANANS
jgi:uncharacterized coiled-coil protein SlyX